MRKSLFFRNQSVSNESFVRFEFILLSSYFLLYLIYLYKFVHLENELTHWLTLVLFPFAVIYQLNKRRAGDSIVQALNSIGVSKEKIRAGLFFAVISGSALGLIQLTLSEQSDAILTAFTSGRFVYAFPLAFLMMLITAGFTEEFFFRGILQTSLVKFFRSRRIGIVIASIFFGIYHLPYAYLLESWPSHGNLTAAFSEAVIMNFILGLFIGWAFDRYQNLLVPIIIHSMMNAYWAMTLIN